MAHSANLKEQSQDETIDNSIYGCDITSTAGILGARANDSGLASSNYQEESLEEESYSQIPCVDHCSSSTEKLTVDNSSIYSTRNAEEVTGTAAASGNESPPPLPERKSRKPTLSRPTSLYRRASSLLAKTTTCKKAKNKSFRRPSLLLSCVQPSKSSDESDHEDTDYRSLPKLPTNPETYTSGIYDLEERQRAEEWITLHGNKRGTEEYYAYMATFFNKDPKNDSTLEDLYGSMTLTTSGESRRTNNGQPGVQERDKIHTHCTEMKSAPSLGQGAHEEVFINEEARTRGCNTVHGYGTGVKTATSLAQGEEGEYILTEEDLGPGPVQEDPVEDQNQDQDQQAYEVQRSQRVDLVGDGSQNGNVIINSSGNTINVTINVKCSCQNQNRA